MSSKKTKFTKKIKEFHFGEWDQITKDVKNPSQEIKNLFPYSEKSFDFHGFDTQKTTAIVENLIFELMNSKMRCVNLISGIGFGHLYEQILDNLSHYSSQFDLDLQNPGLIRVCKK